MMCRRSIPATSSCKNKYFARGSRGDSDYPPPSEEYLVQIIKVEDPPQPNDLDRVPPHCKKKQSLSNWPFIVDVIVAVREI
jgi:hypothetical protein